MDHLWELVLELHKVKFPVYFTMDCLGVLGVYVIGHLTVSWSTVAQKEDGNQGQKVISKKGEKYMKLPLAIPTKKQIGHITLESEYSWVLVPYERMGPT